MIWRVTLHFKIYLKTDLKFNILIKIFVKVFEQKKKSIKLYYSEKESTFFVSFFLFFRFFVHKYNFGTN